MVKRVGKRGDTLIEVMLAVGIFSMVAVAVVAVMSGGTSSAQTALETTLAREEIDAQAEALRFIQSSYIAEKDNVNGKFSRLWEAVTNESIVNSDSISSILQYSPNDCSALYSSVNGEARLHGFVINTQQLGNFNPDSLNTVLISGDQIKSGEYVLSAASTYPHLVFGSKTNNSDSSNLAADNTYTNLYSAEGIYVIAVKDPNSTTIAGESNKSAYYDFYIRTCWYGTGDQTPSTISTVIRLYDPGIVKKNTE